MARQLPFASEGWAQLFQVFEFVGLTWLDKGSFSGEDALQRFIDDGFFEGRKIAVFNQDKMVWTNIEKV